MKHERKLKRMKILDKLGRKKEEVKPELKGRRQGQLALDIRGIDKQSQKNILQALAREKADFFLVKEDEEREGLNES